MIRIDTVWLGVEPLDMRAGTEAALARVVRVFGAAHPHHAYLFANRRANRMKVLVHDGIGVWLAARRLNQGKFMWPKDAGPTLSLTRPQLDIPKGDGKTRPLGIQIRYRFLLRSKRVARG